MAERKLTRKQKLALSKPLKEFDFGLIGEKLEGILINVDRDLQRISREITVMPPPTDNYVQMLNIFVRFATNSYKAALYVGGNAPEDSRRKPNFVIVVPTINRQLLDLLFNMVFIFDEPKTRLGEYMRGGWRELVDEKLQFQNEFSSDPLYRQHLLGLTRMVNDLADDLRIADEDRGPESKFPYWKHPDELKDRETASRPFLRHLYKWFYHDTSMQAHLSFGGLGKIASFINSEFIEDERNRELVERRFLEQFRGQQIGRTIMLALAVASEADAFYQLKNNETIRGVWATLNDFFIEAKEIWNIRYDQLTNY